MQHSTYPVRVMSEDFLILCLQARMTWRSLHQLQIIKLMQRFVILSSYNLGTDCSHSILGCWIQFQCVPLPVCVCACVCGFPSHQQAILWTQLNILHFNRILTLSTWRQHQEPQVKGSVPQDPPSPNKEASHKPRLSPMLLTNGL